MGLLSRVFLGLRFGLPSGDFKAMGQDGAWAARDSSTWTNLGQLKRLGFSRFCVMLFGTGEW